VNKVLVRGKLESLRRCIGRIEEKYPSESAELAADYDRQDIISVNLERAIQTCVDIAGHVLADRSISLPSTMSGLFRVLAEESIIDADLAGALSRAVGLRNLAVHEYQELDWKEMHGFLPAALDDLRRFADVIAANLSRPS
jgi:uncharacterized protein YutE (UPF0331/DUF86 family)